MTGLPAFLVDLVRLSLWLALLALLFAPVERAFQLHGRATPRAMATDLGYFFLNGLAPALLMAPPLALFALVAAALTPAAYADWIAALPFAAKLAAGLLVAEVGSYWGHRLCHRLPVLWRFHAIHHSVTHLDWLANTRAHPVDVVFTRLCGLAPLYALGLASPRATGAEAMIPTYVTLLGTVWSFFVHANVRWRFGWLEQMVATPAFHHWHHHNEAERRDTNFAALLPCVDRLFGTLHLPRRWPECYGVDRPTSGELASELVGPFLPARRPAGPKPQG